MSEGSIIAPSGRRKSWSAMVYLGRDDTGKKMHKRVSAPTEAEVKKKIREVLHQRDNGAIAMTRGTVGEFVERWFKDYADHKLAPRTVGGYRSIYNSGIKPAFGATLLRNLKPEHIQKYYSDKLRKTTKRGSLVSSTTVTHHAMMLHRVLEHAVKWQILPRNPADAASPPGIRHVEMHTLDNDQVADFLDAAKDTPYFVQFHLALFTGMRRSEIMALRWQDVDLMMAEISVSRTLHLLNKPRHYVYRGTKTAKSARKIALDPESCAVLRQHLNHEMDLCAHLGVTFKTDRLLFCTWDGKEMSPDRVSRAWDRLVKRLGLPHVRFHDARHTHASLLFKAEIHPKVVQERLGHANIQTTLNIYSHVTPGMQKRAAEAFGELIRATTGATTSGGEGRIRTSAARQGDGFTVRAE